MRWVSVQQPFTRINGKASSRVFLCWLCKGYRMIDHMLAVHRANLKAGYAKEANWKIITELLKVKYNDCKK